MSRRCVVCSKRRPVLGARWNECPDVDCTRRRDGTCSGACTQIHDTGHARAAGISALTEQSFRVAWAAEFPGKPYPGFEDARRVLIETAKRNHFTEVRE